MKYIYFNFSKNWHVTDGYTSEYGRSVYFPLCRYWIGIHIKWAKDKFGRISISPFDTKMCDVKELKIGYLVFTLYKRNF